MMTSLQVLRVNLLQDLRMRAISDQGHRYVSSLDFTKSRKDATNFYVSEGAIIFVSQVKKRDFLQRLYGCENTECISRDDAEKIYAAFLHFEKQRVSLKTWLMANITALFRQHLRSKRIGARR